jgi:general secretion pathway protein C
MLDARSPEWLSRLQGNGPRLIAFALAALIAVELARIALALLGSTPVKSPQPVAARAAPQMPQSQLDAQNVMAAHIFGVAPPEAASQDPANAPQSTANLQLAGTIATQDPKHGIAIISDGGPSKVYSVGDNVSGASLHSVYLDHVILDRGGVLETLQLPKQFVSSGVAAPRRGASQRTVAAVENVRRMVQQDPGILDQVMRTVPSYDAAAGKLRGFRAYPGRNRMIFNRLGLKPGDLVTAINGTPLDDPQHSQEVFNTIQSSDHVVVTIERGGEKQDITLNIAQVTGQALKDLGEPNASGGPPPGAPSPPGPTPTIPNETQNQ